MRGTLRWARADLRARRGQALITVAVVAGVVAALFLATMLLQGAVNPWQQLFARTRGADVLVYFQNGTNTNELRHVAGIKETGQPYQAAPATLEHGAVKSPVELRAMTQEPPAMSAPLVVTGTWLRSSAQDGSVVERYSTWQQVKDSMANNDRLLGLLLALFGNIALLAAPCAIANVTAGRVLVQRQDIAMLKALGFTPGQVVRMLLAEQTLLGAAGAALGLAIPMAMITIALTCWSTIDGFTSDPGKIGLASAVTVSQGGLENRQMLALIGHDAQVLAAYPGAQSVTLLPGDNGTFYARAMGTSTRPYPFRAVQGRMFRAANEAVAGQGFLDLLHIGVGAGISPTIDGVPVILHIVGRTIEPDNNGDVLDFGLDALNHAGSAPPQLVYHLVLKPGMTAAAARARLLAASHDRLDVQVVPNPASGLRGLQLVIAISV